MKRIVICVLMAAMLCTACAGNEVVAYGGSWQFVVTPIEKTAKEGLTEEQTEALNKFTAKLFQKSFANGDNTVISPVSILYALSMTEGGAKGETLAQMEAMFGMPMEELRECLYLYQMQLKQNKESALYLANSIWFKDDEKFTVENSFLKDHAAYYDAEIFKSAFNKETAKDINDWVAEKTDGQIKEILNDVPNNAVMHLINAVSFEAEWSPIYTIENIKKGVFTTENGKEQKVDFMYRTENCYLEDDMATGFMKYYRRNFDEDSYSGREEYAFVAMLPNEGVTVEEYVSALAERGLNELWESMQTDVPVLTALPKFSNEFSIEMSEVLKDLGVTDAFDEKSADFSGLGQYENENIYIYSVLHKASIRVDERGAKAGASTVSSLAQTTGIAIEPENPKIVYLDRPFVYFIIDCQTNLPLFMGTTMSIE